MIKILEKKFIWLGKSLFFIDYLLQNIVNKLESYKSEHDFMVLNDIVGDMKSFVMKDNKLDYNLIDFTPKIFSVSENIDYINTNKEDDDFINEVFNSPFYNQKYYRMCEELSNIIFGKRKYNKDLRLSLDNLVNQISYYYEKVGNLDKMSLNPGKLHLLEIWKFKLTNVLKNHFKKNLKKEFDEFDNIFENELSDNKIKEDDIESFKISKKNRKKMMKLEDDELDEDETEELDEISKKEAVYLDLQKKKDMSKNQSSIKFKNEMRQKKLLIKNNGFFNYLINKYMNDEELPIYLENKYKQNKIEFDNNLKELNNILKKQNKTSLDSDNKNTILEFIDRITTNFENIKSDGSKYDVKTAISEIKLMSYLEDSNYLDLMSSYAKLTDNLRIINQYEEENDLMFTPKPEILNLIEKLYLNSLGVSSNQNNETKKNRRKKPKKLIHRTINSFEDEEQDNKEDTGSSMFDYLNSMFDIFGNNTNDEFDIDDTVVVKVDEASIIDIDNVFDNNDNSSVLVNPNNIT